MNMNWHVPGKVGSQGHSCKQRHPLWASGREHLEQDTLPPEAGLLTVSYGSSPNSALQRILDIHDSNGCVYPNCVYSTGEKELGPVLLKGPSVSLWVERFCGNNKWEWGLPQSVPKWKLKVTSASPIHSPDCIFWIKERGNRSSKKNTSFCFFIVLWFCFVLRFHFGNESN